MPEIFEPLSAQKYIDPSVILAFHKSLGSIQKARFSSTCWQAVGERMATLWSVQEVADYAFRNSVWNVSAADVYEGFWRRSCREVSAPQSLHEVQQIIAEMALDHGLHLARNYINNDPRGPIRRAQLIVFAGLHAADKSSIAQQAAKAWLEIAEPVYKEGKHVDPLVFFEKRGKRTLGKSPLAEMISCFPEHKGKEKNPLVLVVQEMRQRVMVDRGNHRNQLIAQAQIMRHRRVCG